jgi:hypothetical protein
MLRYSVGRSCKGADLNLSNGIFGFLVVFVGGVVSGLSCQSIDLSTS